MRLTVPTLGEEEVDAVAEVLGTGFLTQGPVTQHFEELIADYVGVSHAIATSSCTTALHLSLEVLGITPGQEVVVPDFTFPATINAVIQQGCNPVIADIDPHTLTMSPESLSRVLSPRTAAVMPVHAFGVCADVNALRDVAPDVPLIEDAACALGSTYRGQQAGSLATVAALSFHPRKVITTGEGGMLVTDRDDLAARARLLCSHGAESGEIHPRFVAPGFNYRLSDVLAAIGVAQMPKLAWIIERRRELASLYGSRLAGVDGITPQAVPVDCETTFQSYVVLLDDHYERDAVIRSLRSRDVECTLGTYSLHMQPAYEKLLRCRPGDLPNGRRAYESSLTLPLFPSMQESDVDLVIEELIEVLKACPSG